VQVFVPETLGDIKPPPATPSDTADPLTARELRKTSRSAARLSPSDRHAASVDLHITDICNDRDALRNEIAILRRELDDLRPRLAAIEESYRGVLASNIFALAMLGLGGAMISGAGYAPDDIWRNRILIAGIASFGWGLIFQISSTWRSAIFRRHTFNPAIPRPAQYPTGDPLPSRNRRRNAKRLVPPHEIVGHVMHRLTAQADGNLFV
jgi:hypothetical protein